MSLFRLYLITLPFGYWVVSRYYPSGPMPWRDFLAFSFLVAIWPLTALIILLVKLGLD